MTPARPPLSVVIATRDRPEHLGRCLATLRPLLGPDDELVVVDSASRDGRTQEVAAAAGAVVLRANLPGTSRARNLGWREARHELVAFTDDDVEVDAGWPDAMARALAPDDTHWVTGWIGVRKTGGGARELNPTMLEAQPARLDRSYHGPMGASANFGARRSALAAVDGFDERFGPGCWTAAAEDLELFDRLILANLPGQYDPQVRVFHEQWRTRRDALTLHWRYGKGMGGRLARLTRRDARRAGRIGYDVVWAQGVHAIWRCLRVRYEFGAALAALRVTGTFVGFAAWLLRP
jgi:glycosyltransferase involved in cell wall biosynthesis